MLKLNDHDQHRAANFKRCLAIIRNLAVEVRSFPELVSRAGRKTNGEKRIADNGGTLAETMEQIFTSINEDDGPPTCERLERLREQARPIRALMEITGVGLDTAKQLHFTGKCSTVEDVRRFDRRYLQGDLDGHLEALRLNNVQRLGLRHVEDFQERIPRAEIEEAAALVHHEANAIQSGIASEVAGSYRRGASESGDIDMLFFTSTRPFLSKLVDRLHKAGFLTDHLTVVGTGGKLVKDSDDFGPEKYMGVYKLGGEGSPYRRIDLRCYM